MSLLIVLLSLAVLMTLMYIGRGWLAWVTAVGILLVGGLANDVVGWGSFFGWLFIVGAVAAVFGFRPLRQALISSWAMKIVGRMLPAMSDTERTALEAGSVWWEGQLFDGDPDWQALLDERPQPLTDEEQAFLDGPVEELCRLSDDWDIQQAGDLTDETWAFLKQKGFLGMIIPKAYGGLGFSAAAHSAVVAKLGSRSTTAAVSVMVPNSLGPAELLMHYGTDEQKTHFLPRLASGEEIPCFALTGPQNGSDASAMDAVGTVCKGEWKGEEIVGMRLSWDKRYTTLGPIATLIGMAFKLRDPDHLLGDEESLGITCALIPADLPGIEIGDRHDPLGIPFHNGPNRGHDVFVPLDTIIGGAARAGHGWRMLMDCLSAGRCISLPSMATGACQLTVRTVGAYATVRKQFGLSIGRFEGIQERLARIAGLTYMVDATRQFGAGAVDAGHQPSVASAIAKAWTTEAMRVVVNDGMDVVAGAGISRGPRNVLARAYQGAPISITVEGANILTRGLIVYGQGAIRCHPFVQAEMKSVADKDLPAFDAAFWGHINHVGTLSARALVLTVTDGWLPKVPARFGTRRMFGSLTRLSTDFALVSEVAMGTLGGNLKRKEMISGRLADTLAWMFMASATLKRFYLEGQPEKDRPFMEWAVRHALREGQQALRSAVENLPNKPAAGLVHLMTMPFGATYRPAGDKVIAEAAERLIEGREGRERLTQLTYIPDDSDPGLGRLEAALAAAVATAPHEQKLRDAIKAGKLDRSPGRTLTERAVEAGVLTEDQRAAVDAARARACDAIQVDAFDEKAFAALRG